MKSILIADPLPLMADTLCSHLKRLTQVKICGVCGCQEVLNSTLLSFSPDLLLLHPGLIKKNSLSFCKRFLENHPATKILLFSELHDYKAIQLFFKAGVFGFLPRTAGPDQLKEAVEQLLKGQIYIPALLRQHLLEASLGLKINSSVRLTRREKEVLQLIIEEHTTKEIASKLYISSSTAETHRLNIIRKLGVRNTAGLVREGVLRGLHL